MLAQLFRRKLAWLGLLAVIATGNTAATTTALERSEDMVFPPPPENVQALMEDAPAPSGMATIDLLVVTSPDFDQANSTTGGAPNRIAALVSRTNKAYRESGIQITVRLVGIGSWAGTPNDLDNDSALDLITPIYANGSAASQYFGNLRTQRQADIVVYLRKYASAHKGVCGVAYVNAQRQSAADPLFDISGYANTGYAVVADGKLANDSFCFETNMAHEIGHLLGSMHDRQQVALDPNPLRRGAYNESFGYRALAGTRAYWSIMAYEPKEFADRKESGVFSAPAISAPCGGVPCGAAEGPNAADNARRFNDVRFKVASWVGTKWQTLSIERGGNGEGAVTGNGINCGTVCAYGYPYNTEITLTAQPEQGSTFTGWEGACTGSGPCKIAVGAALKVTAVFSSPNPRYSVQITKDGRGTGTVSGPGLDCGGTCTTRVAAGTLIVLQASGAPGSEFAKWTGACQGQPATCRLAINEPRSATAVFKGRRVTMISSNGYTSFAVKSDGSLWAWGNNDYGQFGQGHTSSSPVPSLVGIDFVIVEAGEGSAYAIKRDNSLWAWGSNERGNLGDGTVTNRLRPVKIGEGYFSVSAGAFHAVAVKTDGTLWGWGWNLYGQVGNGNQQNQTRPIQIGSGYSTASAGGANSAAVSNDGRLMAWGFNESGQVGDGSFTHRFSPIQIGSDFAKSYSGGNHFFAIKRDGTLWGWGSNTNGELGTGTLGETRTTPVRIEAGFSFAVARGGISSAGLKADRGLWTWGWNNAGSLGDGTNDNYRLVPTSIGGGFILLTGGLGGTFLAVREDGSLWAWGKNQSGELGDGTSDTRLSPVLVFSTD